MTLKSEYQVSNMFHSLGLSVPTYIKKKLSYAIYQVIFWFLYFIILCNQLFTECFGCLKTWLDSGGDIKPVTLIFGQEIWRLLAI